MANVVKKLVRILVGLPLLVLGYLLLARIVRHIYPFPMPHFMANVIDNPLRRRYLHPPAEMPIRHGLQPGMTVLEIGPGNGTYTVGTARYLGEIGHLVAVDIEPHIITRVQHRLHAEGVTNAEARVADAYHLPFEDGHFDAAYMIAVIGEIPDPDRALREVRRVLKPDGTLGLSELLPDPDSPLASGLTRRVTAQGYRLLHKTGNILAYTLLFQKSAVDPVPARTRAHTLMTRDVARRIQTGPRLAYRIGLGPLIGRFVLLLTTTGRKSGLPRTTPLQYETLDGVTYVIAARGDKADWVRNLRADPHASVRVGDRHFAALAELITNPTRIADVLEARLAHHPRMVGAMMRADGLPTPASRADLEAYVEGLVMVGLQPEGRDQRPESGQGAKALTAQPVFTEN